MLDILKARIWKFTRFVRDAGSFLWADLLAPFRLKDQVNASNLEWAVA